MAHDFGHNKRRIEEAKRKKREEKQRLKHMKKSEPQAAPSDPVADAGLPPTETP